MSFFRVLHEASSSWLKFVHAFQKHPVERSNCVKNQKIISPYENRSNKSCSMINHFAAPPEPPLRSHVLLLYIFNFQINNQRHPASPITRANPQE
jgi:hypothetical protein